MNKSVIFIGLGVVALGGLAYWYFSKPSGMSPTPDMGKSPETGGTGSNDNYPSEIGSLPPLEIKSRKEIRRDCRQEARAKCGKGAGKGKPKCRREYRRNCKAQGGFDDGVADFAFNGFGEAFELV